jgi:hypothetical protein
MTAHEGCPDRCGGCFAHKHATHNASWRHEDGRLYSATCDDCAVTYQRTKGCDSARWLRLI